MRTAPILPVTDPRLAALLSVGVSTAVLAPLLQHRRTPPTDSFPLSYYPMFTKRRRPRAKVTHLMGVDGRGRRSPLPYTLAGRGGLNHVRKHLSRTVAAGRADELCRSVAASVARRDEPELAGVVSCEVVSGTYRLATYFSGRTAPVAERVHAAHPVVRDGSGASR